jgi:hypothetical protein
MHVSIIYCNTMLELVGSLTATCALLSLMTPDPLEMSSGATRFPQFESPQFFGDTDLIDSNSSDIMDDISQLHDTQRDQQSRLFSLHNILDNQISSTAQAPRHRVSFNFSRQFTDNKTPEPLRSRSKCVQCQRYRSLPTSSTTTTPSPPPFGRSEEKEGDAFQSPVHAFAHSVAYHGGSPELCPSPDRRCTEPAGQRMNWENGPDHATSTLFESTSSNESRNYASLTNSNESRYYASSATSNESRNRSSLANQQGQRSKRLSIDVDMVIHTTALVKSLMKQIEEDGSFDEEQFQRLGRVLEVQHDAINVLLQHLQE